MICHDCHQEFDMTTGDFENSICPDCLEETNNIESKIYWIFASLIVLSVAMMPQVKASEEKLSWILHLSWSTSTKHLVMAEPVSTYEHKYVCDSLADLLNQFNESHGNKWFCSSNELAR